MSQHDEPAADEPMEVDECNEEDGNDSEVPMEIGTDLDDEDEEKDAGPKVARIKLCHKCGESNTRMVKLNPIKFMHKRQKIKLLFQVICLDGNWAGCEKMFHISCLDIDDKESAKRDG